MKELVLIVIILVLRANKKSEMRKSQSMKLELQNIKEGENANDKVY